MIPHGIGSFLPLVHSLTDYASHAERRKKRNAKSILSQRTEAGNIDKQPTRGGGGGGGSRWWCGGRWWWWWW